MTNEERVRQFMKMAGQECPDKPTIAGISTALFRLNLIGEELEELKEGMVEKNLELIADSVVDLLYVVYGLGITYGIPVQKVFEEVHRSNMTKFIDGRQRDDGKWLKGMSWTPPNIKPILHEHGSKSLSES